MTGGYFAIYGAQKDLRPVIVFEHQGLQGNSIRGDRNHGFPAPSPVKSCQPKAPLTRRRRQRKVCGESIQDFLQDVHTRESSDRPIVSS